MIACTKNIEGGLKKIQKRLLVIEKKILGLLKKDAEDEAFRQKSFLIVTKSKKINVLSAKKKYV